MIEVNDMYGYKIKINSLPKLKWACETTFNNYEWQNQNATNMLEISFTKFNSQTIIIDNNSHILKNSALCCVPANENRKAFCKPEDPITVVTVAVEFDDFSFEPHEITETDYSDNTRLLLPAFLEGLSLSEELELIKMTK